MGVASSSNLGGRVANKALFKLDYIIREHANGKDYKIQKDVYICYCDKEGYSERLFWGAAGEAQREVNRSNSKFNVNINPKFNTEDGTKVVNFYMDIYPIN